MSRLVVQRNQETTYIKKRLRRKGGLLGRIRPGLFPRWISASAPLLVHLSVALVARHSLPATKPADDRPTPSKPVLPDDETVTNTPFGNSSRLPHEGPFRAVGAIRSACRRLSIKEAESFDPPSTGFAIAQALQKDLKRALRHSAQGRCPAARAVASSKKNGVYSPGVMSCCCRPLKFSKQMIQRISFQVHWMRPWLS